MTSFLITKRSSLKHQHLSLKQSLPTSNFRSFNNFQKVNTLHTYNSFIVSRLLSLLTIGLMTISLMAGSSKSYADMALTLEWTDLIPPKAREQIVGNQAAKSKAPLVDHSGGAIKQSTLPEVTEINMALNGKFVKIAGFMVPLDGHDNKVTAFLLVPYFGACIHVPPPPANQIVYVEFQKGVDADTIYDPVWITGPLQAGRVSTEMAESGYSIMAESVTPYELTDDESNNR